MKRVLLVSPHFCPVNAPDMQRVRLALPHLRALGWEPVVLALAPETVEGAVLDPLLEKTYPADTRVVRVRGLPPRLTRAFGFGALWLRAGRALRKAGDALLAREKFDLVVFSTTQCDAFKLGPRWLAKFGVPFALDYQDPWVNDYYARTGVRPPGGRLRYALADRRARRDEPRVLRLAAGVASVSSAYVEDLARRYPWFDRSRAAVIPFGASPADVALARNHAPAASLLPTGDGRLHLVYTGRAGADLAPALRLLFSSVSEYRIQNPAAAEKLRLHFIGTSYAPPALARESVAPVAHEFGVRNLVSEHPARVSYFDALNYLARADAVLAVGSDDPAYTPSKIVPCLLVGRPVLAILHPRSPAVAVARSAGAHLVALAPEAEAREQILAWLQQLARPPGPPPASASDLAPLLAEARSRQLAEFFDRSVQP